MEKNTWGQYFAKCYDSCRKRPQLWMDNAPPVLEEEKPFSDGVFSNGSFEPDMGSSSAPVDDFGGHGNVGRRGTSNRDGSKGEEFFEIGRDQEDDKGGDGFLGEDGEEVVVAEKKKEKKKGWGTFWGGGK